jgi:hypothetical protein
MLSRASIYHVRCGRIAGKIKGKSHVDYLDGQAYAGRMAKRKNPHAVALSKLGAGLGGRARADKLTAEQRRDIARKAARARWAKAKGESPKPS